MNEKSRAAIIYRNDEFPEGYYETLALVVTDLMDGTSVICEPGREFKKEEFDFEKVHACYISREEKYLRGWGVSDFPLVAHNMYLIAHLIDEQRSRFFEIY